MKSLAKLLSLSLVVILSQGIWFAGNIGALGFTPHTPIIISSSVASNEACQGVGLVSGTGGCENQTNGSQLNSVLATFINVFSAIVGLVAVIMIIVAGLQFITANANPQNIAKARSSLLYAIVGLVVVVLAQVIVHFVITQASAAVK